jgi:hypothetical protein
VVSRVDFIGDVVLEQRFDHPFGGQLHDLIFEAANPKQPAFLTPWLRDVHPKLGLRPVAHPLEAGGQILQIRLQIVCIHRLGYLIDAHGFVALEPLIAGSQMIDVGNVVIQRRKHQIGIRSRLAAYPVEVWAHR